MERNNIHFTINTPVEFITGVFKLEKYGFVYIWFDCKHKRYYVGCHWGTEDDGYICSSNWMRNSYSRRPEDFKRRIIKTGISSKKETFLEETRYLGMIKPEELRIRYYNKMINLHHWLCDDDKTKTVRQKMRDAKLGKKRGPHSEEHKEKIRQTLMGHVQSEESKLKMSETRTGKYCGDNSSNKGLVRSEETKQKIREANLGKKSTETANQKRREASSGKFHTDEAKLKISRANSGRRHSDETKRKMSEIKLAKRKG